MARVGRGGGGVFFWHMALYMGRIWWGAFFSVYNGGHITEVGALFSFFSSKKLLTCFVFWHIMGACKRQASTKIKSIYENKRGVFLQH